MRLPVRLTAGDGELPVEDCYGKGRRSRLKVSGRTRYQHRTGRRHLDRISRGDQRSCRLASASSAATRRSAVRPPAQGQAWPTYRALGASAAWGKCFLSDSISLKTTLFETEAGRVRRSHCGISTNSILSRRWPPPGLGSRAAPCRCPGRAGGRVAASGWSASARPCPPCSDAGLQ